MMKKVSIITLVFALFVSVGAKAEMFGDWFGGNNNNAWEDNDWPEWTPMYWMEEMSSEFDDDDNERYRRYNDRGYDRGYNNYAPRYNQPPAYNRNLAPRYSDKYRYNRQPVAPRQQAPQQYRRPVERAPSQRAVPRPWGSR